MLSAVLFELEQGESLLQHKNTQGLYYIVISRWIANHECLKIKPHAHFPPHMPTTDHLLCHKNNTHLTIVIIVRVMSLSAVYIQHQK